jgi:diguanylate cyclase (GGDEF)-like protein/PAS domain S-box-containing protein
MDLGRGGAATREVEEEVRSLRARLADAEGALQAIRDGEVDAVVVPGPHGARIYTLMGAESAYRSLVEAMNEGAALLGPGGVLLYCNSRLARMLGIPLEAAVGSSLAAFVAPAAREQLDALLAQGQTSGCAGEFAILGANGAPVPVQLSLGPIEVHGRALVCLVATDLTERKRVEDLRLLSTRDELTGLLNRRGFFGLAEQQLKVARRSRSELLLIFADLDGLKPLNDTLGHSEGDRALVDAAEILRQTFRESDIVARMGGDEFAVLADAGQGTWGTLSRRVQEGIDAFNRRCRRSYALSISLGCARFGDGDSGDLEALLRRADAAMYQEKRAHRENPATPPVRSQRAPQEPGHQGKRLTRSAYAD